jgi:hypothetical protein
MRERERKKVRINRKRKQNNFSDEKEEVREFGEFLKCVKKSVGKSLPN